MLNFRGDHKTVTKLRDIIRDIIGFKTVVSGVCLTVMSKFVHASMALSILLYI